MIVADLELSGVVFRFTAKVYKAHVHYRVEWLRGNIAADNAGYIDVSTLNIDFYSADRLLVDRWVGESIGRYIASRLMPYPGRGDFGSHNAYYHACDIVNARRMCKSDKYAKVVTSQFLRQVWSYAEYVSRKDIWAIQKRAIALMGNKGLKRIYMAPGIYDTYWAKDALRMNAAHYFAASLQEKQYENNFRYQDPEFICWFNNWQGMLLENQGKPGRVTLSNMGRFKGDIIEMYLHPIAKSVRWWVHLELLAACARTPYLHHDVAMASTEDVKQIIEMIAAYDAAPIASWVDQKAVRKAILWFHQHSGQIQDESADGLIAGVTEVIRDCERRRRARRDYHMGRDYDGGVLDAEWYHPSKDTKYPSSGIEIPNAVQIMNYGDLYAEGKNMHHCVASYHRDVLNGSYFVYHIEYNGAKATIGVYANEFTLDQVRGPCNQNNAATQWVSLWFANRENR